MLDAEQGAGVSPERQQMLSQLIAFAQVTVRQLRREPVLDPATGCLGQISAADAILSGLAAQIAALLRAGRLVPVEALALNDSLTRLSQALVSCERLANTPVPFAYTLLLHRTAYLFCFMLPFGLADGMGWATPLAVMLVAYTFFGLDALAEELEEPFAPVANGLPLTTYAVTIERHMRAAMGETVLPPLPQPRDFMLS